MIKNVKQYIEPFVTLGEPIPYKALKIYPFLLKDYYNLMLSIDVLTQEKDKINNPDIIQMSYLDYIVKILFEDTTFNEQWQEQNQQVWKRKFNTIISYSLKCEITDINFCFDKKGKIFLIIKDQKILAKHFNDIIKIILYSNIPKYSDEYVSPDVQEVINNYLKQQSNKSYDPSLQQKILFIMSETGMQKSDILNLTVVEFGTLFNLLIEKLEYKINRTAELSGNVEFKEKIEHFILSKPKTIYDSIFQAKSGFDNKMGINK